MMSLFTCRHCRHRGLMPKDMHAAALPQMFALAVVVRGSSVARKSSNRLEVGRPRPRPLFERAHHKTLAGKSD
jgi:hypothetical protein